ncbi:hybrid sensor histidine kinase/response regulator [Larkinella sp. VNQ87]|uniref:hybrid sensor histidine kinase/response regulator n=1 Tax=Larkinella sp. VNQ87 TaxID=3400921 RepID=UPI003C01771E
MPAQILVIEDEVQIRENVAEWLRLNGFEVETAADGMKGVTRAVQVPPDLILCDIMMPGMNGHQVLETIRGNQALAAIPFLFLTGKTDPVDQRYGMTLGADDYLTKPFTSENLLLAIESRLQREALRKASLRAQLTEQHLKVIQSTGHEYNTPLNGILGFANLLADHYDEFDRADKVSMLDMIRVCGLRLKRSLDNVRLMDTLQVMTPSHEAYPAFTTGKTHIDADFMEQLVRTVERRQDEQIRRSIDVQPAQLGIGEENFQTIVDELLDNAAKFSNPASLIAVTGLTLGSMYRLSISNEGRFFKPEDISQMAPYRQFGRKQYEQQGFGLGLSIVQKLVELNKGTLTIESQDNRWTTVSVQLPIVPVNV